MKRILICEDEPGLASFLEKGLRSRGYTTKVVGDGASAAAIASDDDFDLAILDLGLPDTDGLSVLRELRRRGERMPVIILTARDDLDDKVDGLDAGGDDYITKPFRLEELLARVRVRLREGKAAEPTVLEAGGVTLDLRTRQAMVERRAVDLTAREFTMLETFMRHRAGPQPRAAARPRLGLRLRPGLERGRGLRPLSASQARRARSRPCAGWDTALATNDRSTVVGFAAEIPRAALIGSS